MNQKTEPAWLAELRQVLGGEGLLSGGAELEAYARDECAREDLARLPRAVARPGSEEEAAEVLRICARHRLPVTARGGGTGLSGACVPVPGGLVLSLERLTGILEVDRQEATLTAAAGTPLRAVFEAAGAAGLFFPPHPGDEGATVGGVVATNAGGARAVKYGTIRRFLLGLRVVLADGRILELGGKRLKSSTGYQLMELMLGSEGTLGLITRVTFALLPAPGSLQTLVAPFPSIEQAVGAVPALGRAGIVPCAVEFIPHEVIRSTERMLQRSWPTHAGAASLMIVLDGPDEEKVLAEAERIADLLDGHGALDTLIAGDRARQEEILELRSLLYEALRPGTAELFDICVPRSQIAGHVGFLRELEQRLGVPLPTYGHAADGNIHTHLMRRFLRDGELGGEVPGWAEKQEAVRREIYDDAMKRGGVISGEHGIGLVKKAYLEQNLGRVQVEVMRAIKQALDPAGILNPDKIFDP